MPDAEWFVALLEAEGVYVAARWCVVATAECCLSSMRKCCLLVYHDELRRRIVREETWMFLVWSRGAIRVSPYLYNTMQEVKRLCELLEAALNTHAGRSGKVASKAAL